MTYPILHSKTTGKVIHHKSDGKIIYGDPANCPCCGDICHCIPGTRPTYYTVTLTGIQTCPCCKLPGPNSVLATHCDDLNGTYLFYNYPVGSCIWYRYLNGHITWRTYIGQPDCSSGYYYDCTASSASLYAEFVLNPRQVSLAINRVSTCPGSPSVLLIAFFGVLAVSDPRNCQGPFTLENNLCPSEILGVYLVQVAGGGTAVIEGVS